MNEKVKEKEKKYLLIGKKVKLVVKEPGSIKPEAIRGKIIDITDKMVVFETRHGIGSFNFDYVIAIKPIDEDYRRE